VFPVMRPVGTRQGFKTTSPIRRQPSFVDVISYLLATEDSELGIKDGSSGEFVGQDSRNRCNLRQVESKERC
jgi:hypothetical protein